MSRTAHCLDDEGDDPHPKGTSCGAHWAPARHSSGDDADAIAVSAATVRNIQQNLFGALFYNILGIPIAAGALYPLSSYCPWQMKAST